MPGWIGPGELIPLGFRSAGDLGAKRLPEIDSSLGSGMREFGRSPSRRSKRRGTKWVQLVSVTGG
jgi:mttA/Hcf106 family